MHRPQKVRHFLGTMQLQAQFEKVTPAMLKNVYLGLLAMQEKKFADIKSIRYRMRSALLIPHSFSRPIKLYLSQFSFQLKNPFFFVS
jgi:hypothetical protein